MFTFVCDDNKFFVTEDQLSKYPTSLLFQVAVEGKSSELIVKESDNSFVCLVSSGSLAVVVRHLRGYKTKTYDLSTRELRDARQDLERLGFPKILTQKPSPEKVAEFKNTLKKYWKFLFMAVELGANKYASHKVAQYLSKLKGSWDVFLDENHELIESAAEEWYADKKPFSSYGRLVMAFLSFAAMQYVATSFSGLGSLVTGLSASTAPSTHATRQQLAKDALVRMAEQAKAQLNSGETLEDVDDDDLEAILDSSLNKEFPPEDEPSEVPSTLNSLPGNHLLDSLKLAGIDIGELPGELSGEELPDLDNFEPNLGTFGKLASAIYKADKVDKKSTGVTLDTRKQDLKTLMEKLNVDDKGTNSLGTMVELMNNPEFQRLSKELNIEMDSESDTDDDFDMDDASTSGSEDVRVDTPTDMPTLEVEN